MKIYLQRIEGDYGKRAKVPTYATEGSTGADLFVANGVVFESGCRTLLHTGWRMAAERHCDLQIRPRSGMCLKRGITVLNSPGTIDSDYRGEVRILVVNLSQAKQEILRGERVAQLVCNNGELCEFIEVDRLADTIRGTGGFGSTGER
jgi:dUTP pyrophosphatase